MWHQDTKPQFSNFSFRHSILQRREFLSFSGQVNVSFSLRIDAVELEIASAAHLFTMFMTQVAAERDRFKIVWVLLFVVVNVLDSKRESLTELGVFIM